MDLIWGKPVASTDSWVGSVSGAVVDLDDRAVTSMIVRRGLLLPRHYAVPMEEMLRSDPDGLYLGIGTTALFDLQADGPQESPPSSASIDAGTRVSSEDGVVFRSRGLRLSDDGAISHLVLSRSRWVGQRLLVPERLIVAIDASSVSLGVDAAELLGLPALRADEHVHDDLWESLYGSQVVPPVDLAGVRLDVAEGVVRLEGNVRSPTAIADTERVVRSIAGVVDVDNALVSDWDIDLALASNIAGAAPRLAGTVSARAQLGAVQLEGSVPSEDARQAVIEAVRPVPGVLSVEDGLEVREAPEEAVLESE